MKKTIFAFSISISLLLAPSAFANECLDNIEDHIYNWGIQLDLANCQINDNDMQIVADYVKKSPRISQVFLNENEISAQGISYLKTTSVTWLDVSNNKLGLEGAAIVAQFSNIQTLEIGGNNIGDEGAIALEKNQTIEQLSVGNNNMTAVGIRAIVSMPLFYLNLNKSHLDKDALTAISNAKVLHTLSIEDCDLSQDDAVLLAANPKSLKLNDLSIRFNPIGNKGIKAIAQIDTLQFLFAESCSIGDEGAIAVSKMPNRFSILSLELNHIGDEGAQALAKMYLDSLWIGYNLIGDEGASAFADAKMNGLLLDHNMIEDAGAIALAKNTSLKYLSVEHNMIGSQGIEALHNSKIEEVYTAGNIPNYDFKKMKRTHLSQSKYHPIHDKFYKHEGR